MRTVRDFRNLKVWERAHLLTVEIYRATERFPRSEQFGMTSQLRRAAASVPTNIAEDCGRGSRTELARFLQIAMGSASELDYLLLLAQSVGYLDAEHHAKLTARTTEIKKMLASYNSKLKADG